MDKGKYGTGLVTLLGLLEISALPAAMVLNGFLGPLVSIFGACYGLYQARNRGIRNAALRGSVYGVTAWAFDDPIPQLPKTLVTNLRNATLLDAEKEIILHRAAWQQMVRQSYLKLNSFCGQKGIDKNDLKRYYRSQSITYGLPLKEGRWLRECRGRADRITLRQTRRVSKLEY